MSGRLASIHELYNIEPVTVKFLILNSAAIYKSGNQSTLSHLRLSALKMSLFYSLPDHEVYVRCVLKYCIQG